MILFEEASRNGNQGQVTWLFVIHLSACALFNDDSFNSDSAEEDV